MGRTITMTAGVYFREIDVSQYIRELTATKLALVGVAAKGDTNKDLLITSLKQGIDTLGVPKEEYPGLLVMREFFNAGGGELHFVRVAVDDLKAAVTVPLIDDLTSSTFEALTTGSFYNDLMLQISYSSQLSQLTTEVHDFPIGDDSLTLYLPNPPLVPGTVNIKFGSTRVASDDGNGALVFDPLYPEYTGFVDYISGALVISTDTLTSLNSTTINVTSSYWSTYDIQVKFVHKDQDDKIINRYIVESFRGLTLATAVERLSKSQYITLLAAPDAFPYAGQYFMAGGDDGATDVDDVDYIGNTIGIDPTGLQVYAFPDQVDINVVAIPGVSSLAVRQALIQLVEVARADTLALLDPPVGLSIQEVADWADGNNDFNTFDTIDSTYAAIYYPDYKTFNNVTGLNDITPPSAIAVQALVRSDPWQAPAGPIRGKVQNIIEISPKLNPTDRAFLDDNRINSIAKLHGFGEMVLGQRTATLSATSLDRVAARRMLMRIEKAVTTALYPLLFEPNTKTTWQRAIMLVQPYLDALVAKEQIYFGKFICDDSINIPQTINNNQMIAVCRLQLLKYAEIIVVNFLIEALGTQITENQIAALTAF